LPHFKLFSRSYCHLCEDMLHALQVLGSEYRFTVEVIDVDADPLLVERYDELVPVLIGSKEGAADQKLCHYFLNEAAVRAFMT
jgi:thiol-disulfide isomerase/thioredoxin